LVLLPEQRGGIVVADNIPELKVIADLPLGKDDFSSTLETVMAIKEKCKKAVTNKECNACALSDKPMCMMKLFSTNPMYRPSPHQALEFGDVSFTVTLNGVSCELVGIAKSAMKNRDGLNIGEAPAREMLQQVLSATHDARIGIIAAICPMRFHDQLIEELRYIAKLTGKPLVIMDDMFMVQQYKAYLSKQTARQTGA
jgi:hypothetical protein